MKRRILSGKSKPDANTLLLLNCNNFKDSSIYNREILNGNTSLSDNGKFGKCLNLDGAGYKLRTPMTPFNFGSGDFTFDFWFKLKSSKSNAVLVNAGTINTWRYGYQISLDDPGRESILLVFAPNPSAIRIEVSYDKLKEGFNHIAFTKQGSTMYAFYNGVKMSDLNASSIPNSIEPYLSIGSHSNGDGGMDCYIDEFRISNIARWTSNFTPPTKPY